MIRIIRPSALLLAVLAGSAVGLWALSLARAQVIDPTTGLTYPDPRVLGSSWWQLGLLVFAVMASLKRAAGRKWGEDVTQWPRVLRNAWTWYLAAVGLGVVAAFALSGMRYGAAVTFQGLTYPWTVLAFGVLAGLVGAGGRDALKWFGEVIGSALSATTSGRTNLTITAQAETGTVPEPGRDGSPQTNGNEQVADVPAREAATSTGIQMFAGFGAGAALQGVLANPLVEGVIRSALQGLGLPTDAQTILKVAVKIAPDLLLDGNAMLGESSLAVINNAVIDVALEHGLLQRP